MAFRLYFIIEINVIMFIEHMFGFFIFYFYELKQQKKNILKITEWMGLWVQIYKFLWMKTSKTVHTSRNVKTPEGSNFCYIY